MSYINVIKIYNMWLSIVPRKKKINISQVQTNFYTIPKTMIKLTTILKFKINKLPYTRDFKKKEKLINNFQYKIYNIANKRTWKRK